MGTAWIRRVGGMWFIAGVVLTACSDDGVANAGDSESTGSPGTSPESSGTPADSSSSGGVGTTGSPPTSDTTEGSSTGAEPGSTGAESSSTGAESGSTGTESSSTGNGSSSEGSSSGGAMMESSTGDPSDPSVGFIDPSEGGANECDVWEQDCPDGEKCMPWADDGGNSWNALRCTPLDPAPVAVGGVCTVEGSAVSGIDDCELGAICWGVDLETNLGTCLGMCTGSPEAPSCADPTASCSISNNGVLILCLPGCDPLVQDCAPAEVCVATGDTFVCAPDSSGDEGQSGDPCEFLNVCDPGLSCLAPEVVPGCLGFSGCCSPYCDVSDLGASADCVTALGVGVECIPFYAEGAAPPGNEDVGICALPA